MANDYLLDRIPLFTNVFGFGYYNVTKDGRFVAKFPKDSDVKLKPSANAFYNSVPG